MKQPEIILVTLANGDVALFVNGDAVITLDAQDSGQNPAEIGDHLAKALGVEMQTVSMDVPSDSDWSWNDVYELLPASPTEPRANCIPVKYWDAYHEEGTLLTHQIDVLDRRHGNGQLFVDMGAIEGDLDDMLSLTMEINTNPLNGIDHVPCAHVHFDSNALAVSLFKVGDRILVRPETDVGITPFRQTRNGVVETFFWIETKRP